MKTFRASETFEPQASKMGYKPESGKKIILANTDYDIISPSDKSDPILIKYYIDKRTWVSLPLGAWEVEKYGIKSQHLTLESITEILNNIKFLPSCVDFNWDWEVVEVNGVTNLSDEEIEKKTNLIGKFDKRESIEGFLINTTFRRPDINTGVIGTGKGRRMWIEADASETSIVMTAWVLVELILKHEAMESITYNGAKILNPHKSLAELAYPEQLQHELENNEQGHH